MPLRVLPPGVLGLESLPHAVLPPGDATIEEVVYAMAAETGCVTKTELIEAIANLARNMAQIREALEPRLRIAAFQFEHVRTKAP